MNSQPEPTTKRAEVSAVAEPMIAALGEDIRPAVATLEKIFHDYGVGNARGCVYCRAMFGGLGVVWDEASSDGQFSEEATE